MTSCGCFECIAAILPEANGIMIVDRDFTGMTPCRNDLFHLSGADRRRYSDPRLYGNRKDVYLESKIYIRGRGQKRIVWMTKQLKEEVGTGFKVQLAKMGMGMFDKIITEEDAEDPEKLVEKLQEVGHPVLEMDPLF